MVGGGPRAGRPGSRCLAHWPALSLLGGKGSWPGLMTALREPQGPVSITAGDTCVSKIS